LEPRPLVPGLLIARNPAAMDASRVSLSVQC
jgi:hypothetical protein